MYGAEMQKTDPSKNALDNHANQLNETHPDYHRSRGASEADAVAAAEKARAGKVKPDGESGGASSSGKTD
jgi:hypothetical protein